MTRADLERTIIAATVTFLREESAESDITPDDSEILRVAASIIERRHLSGTGQ
jgi:hypothetical protein